MTMTMESEVSEPQGVKWETRDSFYNVKYL